MHRRIVVSLASWAVALVLPAAALAQSCPSNPAPSTAAPPALKGRIVFQSTNADPTKDALYIEDFASGTTTQLSFPGAPMSLISPINPNFSPDGHWVVFSAHWKLTTGDYRYDVFVARTDGTHLVNMTINQALPWKNEDGRFSFDGKQIVYKRRNDSGTSSIGELWSMKVMLPATGDPSVVGQPKALLYDGHSEFSAPGLSPTGRYLYYQKGAHAAAAVYRHDLRTKLAPQFDEPVSVVPNTERYYPVVRDFTAVLLSGWANSSNNFDQLLLAAPGVLGSPLLLPLNDPAADDSDPAPLDEDYVVFSSDRCDASKPGPMSLYVGSIASKDYWPLDVSGVGGSLMGTDYTPTAAPK